MKKKIKPIFNLFLVFSLVFIMSCKKEEDFIKVGAIIPLTGGFASYGEPVRDGMMLAVEEINNDGGINGKKLMLIIEDDSGVPKDSVNSFSKLVNIDSVQLILGPLSSGCSMATASLANKMKVVQISTLAGIPALSNAGDYVFRVYPSSKLGARFAADSAIKRFTPKKVAILYQKNPFGEAAKEIFKEISEKSKIEIVFADSFSDGQNDFRTLLTKMNSFDPDLLLCSAYWGEGSKILAQMIELGIDIQVVGEDGWRGPIAQIVGEKGLKNLYIADIAFGKEIEGNDIMRKFIENFEKKYNRKSDTYAATGYDAVYLAKKVIEKVGYNAEDIKNALYEMKYKGALGSIKFDKNGDNIGLRYEIFQLNKENEAFLSNI